MTAIINARVLTMAGPVYENGFVCFEQGRIIALGEMKDYPGHAETERDAQGAWLLPGFIDAHCHLGLFGDGLRSEGEDGNEDSDPVTPQLSALDGMNALDRGFSEAAAAGVTTVITGPGSANPIAGQIVAVKTVGKRADNMVLQLPVAMKMAFGENPKFTYHAQNRMPVTRMGTASTIREALKKAQDYATEQEKALQNEEKDEPEFDAKCEALLPVLKGTLPVHAHAHRADDLFTALRIAKEFSLRMVLVHATEGYLVAEELKQDCAGAFVGPIISDRSKPELVNQSVENAAALSRAGIPVAIVTDHPVVPIQYLCLSAALCAKAGMDRMEALRAITLTPARLCGLDSRVGSLEVGKDADMVLWDNDPLELFSRVLGVYINGNQVQG